MVICFTIGGVRHCYVIPVILWPWGPRIPGPGPVNYQALVADATIVASMLEATKSVSDEGARKALVGGINSAVQAMGKRAGEHVSIELEGGSKTR